MVDPRVLEISPDDLTLGRELADGLRTLCDTNRKFKGVVLKDAAQWGVVLDSDERFTEKQFGDFKAPKRQTAEEKLLDYMCSPSPTRSAEARDTKGDFLIAVTMAPPGTGKSRLLDDAMRMPLQSRHFEHFLRLAITFNGELTGAYNYPISVRVLRQFFCATVSADNVPDVLSAIDELLVAHFAGEGEFNVSRSVFGAVEALYFSQRGGKLGRTVLMVDEISKAVFVPSDRNAKLLAVVKGSSEQAAYRIVAAFVDGASLSKAYGRRGAVITVLDYIEAGSIGCRSGRKLLWLQLGTFDVWSGAAQSAISGEARRIGLLQDGQVVDDRVWSLLAATGGRPREISAVLYRWRCANLVDPSVPDLVQALFTSC